MKLKVGVKDLAPCEKSLSVNVPVEDIKEEYQLVYKEIAKVAKIPGFRPGKAPAEQVAIHYKSEAREEVLKKLVSKSLKQALKEKSIEPLFNPEIHNLDFTEDKLSYEARVEVRPEIKLSKYTGIKVKKSALTVEEKEIDEVIERLRDGYAKFVPVEDRGLELGDFLIADLKVTADGKEIESRQDDWIEYKEKGFLPEFSNAIKGLKPGDEKEVKIDFPADYGRKELAGKKVDFKLKVKEIKRKELPAVTPEFAKEVGEYASIEDFRNAVKSDLVEQKEKQDEHRLQNEILEAIAKDSKFDLPKGVVERRVNHLMEEAAKNMMYQGIKQEEIVKQKDEVRAKLKPEAEKQVRLSFILDKVADLEKLEVTEEELHKKFDEIAAQVKQPKERVIEYYQQEDMIGSLVLQMLNQKVLKFLREKAEII